MSDYHRIRGVIVDQVNQFFGRNIAIEDRCLDFLGSYPNPCITSHMIQRLLISEPALLNAWHQTIKVLSEGRAFFHSPLAQSPEAFFSSQASDAPDLTSFTEIDRRINLERLLQECFLGRKTYYEVDPDVLSYTGDEVRKKKNAIVSRFYVCRVR